MNFRKRIIGFFKNVVEKRYNIKNPDSEKELKEEKISIYSLDETTISEYTPTDLANLIKESIDEQQIPELFELELFKNLGWEYKAEIIKLIENDDEKIKLLKNPNFVGDSDTSDLDKGMLIRPLSDYVKIQCIFDTDIIKDERVIGRILQTLSDENKEAILSNNKLNKFEFSKWDLSENLIKGFRNEEKRIELMIMYQANLNVNNYINILCTLSIDTLIKFIESNEGFLETYNIKIYEITRKLKRQGQIEFVSKIEELNISSKEKKLIFATLSRMAKEEIDTSKIQEEYLIYLKQNYDEENGLHIDWNQDLEIYRELDEILEMPRPLEMSKDQRKKIPDLCRICPQKQIEDDLYQRSTLEEYIYIPKIG